MNLLFPILKIFYQPSRPQTLTPFKPFPRGEFEQLQLKFPDLFHNDFIKRADRDFKQVKNIHLDKFLCVGAKKNYHLGVGILKKSIALGGIGNTPSGKTFLALGHIKYTEAKEAIAILKDELMSKRCEESSIKFYAVGGVLKGVHEDDGSSFELQKDLLSLVKDYKICGIKFNMATSDDVLQVVFDPSGMYYSKQEIFALTDRRHDEEQDWF
jgi:hypothetical protein